MNRQKENETERERERERERYRPFLSICFLSRAVCDVESLKIRVGQSAARSVSRAFFLSLSLSLSLARRRKILYILCEIFSIPSYGSDLRAC